MTTNDGGPAFPIEPNSPGMSLRDYFAAKAMQAMLSTCYETMRGKEDAKSSAEADRTTFARDFMITEEDGPPEVASDAYTIADAMIAARQPEPLR